MLFLKSYILLLRYCLQCILYINFILNMLGLQLGAEIYKTNSTGFIVLPFIEISPTRLRNTGLQKFNKKIQKNVSCVKSHFSPVLLCLLNQPRCRFIKNLKKEI